MRVALAILMALHGIAHTPGFATSWKLAPAGGIPYKTTVFGGRLDLGGTGIRAVGILWLVVALAFLVGAAATVVDTPWWRSMALVTALASLALSLLELPLARIGVFINLFIVVMVWAL